MKSKLYLLTFLLITSLTIAQSPKSFSVKIFLDSLKNETSEENHKYYRIVKEYNSNKERYEFSEYYKSGKIALRGATKDKDKIILDGNAISYYENGTKKVASNYTASYLNGPQFKWYENGKMQFVKEFTFDPVKKESTEKVIQYWDENNNQNIIDGNGIYDNQTELTRRDQNEISFFGEKGEIKNGVREGIWTGRSLKLKITFTESYENGKLISGVSTDENNMNYNYSEVMQKPMAKNGINSFYKYIGQNYNTPKVQGLQGQIYLTFVVDKEGKLVEPKVLRDLGYGTGTEAIRIINTAKNWLPGKMRVIPIRTMYSLPITIRSISPPRSDETPNQNNPKF